MARIRVKCNFGEKWIECTLWVCITFAVIESGNLILILISILMLAPAHDTAIHVYMIY